MFPSAGFTHSAFPFGGFPGGANTGPPPVVRILPTNLTAGIGFSDVNLTQLRTGFQSVNVNQGGIAFTDVNTTQLKTTFAGANIDQSATAFTDANLTQLRTSFK